MFLFRDAAFPFKKKTKGLFFWEFVSAITFFVRGWAVWAADELDPREDVNATGEEHGEAFELHTPVGAGGAGSGVPLVVVPALGLVVDVVEKAVLRHQQGIALERPGCCCSKRKTADRKQKQQRKRERETHAVS